MNKRLVAYFSASGVTAKVAENLADAIGADIFEIQPEVPYTKADLNWMDKKARTTIEMSDPTSRPAIAAKRDNIDEYDTIHQSAFEVLPSPVIAASGTKASPLPIAHCPADRKTMPNSDAEIPQTILPATQQESAAGLSSPAPILTAIESLS